jgi:hypothetical protein
MKKITLLFFAMLFGMHVFAQDKKGYLAFSIGPAFSIGDFASVDLNNKYAGFASTGIMYNLSLAYELGSNLGIITSLRKESSGIDEEGILNELEKQVPQANWTVESKNWTTRSFLVGLYGSFPFGAAGKSSFDIRAMLGYVSASVPELDISGTYNSAYAYTIQQAKNTGSAGYLIGVGFKFNLSAAFCLLINADYFNAKPEFENVETVSNFSAPVYNTFQQPFQTISISAGFGLRL